MNHTDRKRGPTRRKPDWGAIFAALDRAGVPEDFLSDRNDGEPQHRPCLDELSTCDEAQFSFDLE